MYFKLALIACIILVGILTGDRSLQSAHAATPPIDWSDLPFVFCGTAIGMAFVVGFQVLRTKADHGRLALIVMSAIAVYLLSTGVSAALVAKTSSPANYLFVSMGSGAIVGLLISWLLFKARHLNKQKQADA